MKKKNNKTIILAIVVVLLIIIGSINFYRYLEYRKTDDYQLKKIGYNNEEVELIKTLNQKDIETIKTIDYNKNIQSLIKEEEFNKNQFKEYFVYQKSHKTTSEETVFIINNNLDENNEYNEKKIKEYMAFASRSNLDANTSVALVNANIPYSDIIPLLQKEKYYIEDHLIRYINYYNKTKKDTVDVVRDVNANLDYEFYTNIKKTDLEKGNLILVNKYYQLDKDYVPEDLVTIEGNESAKKEVADAYQQMKQDAAKEGLLLSITSGYRSYETQNIIYNRYKNEHGLEWADSYSARPGHSEHQTGLALDITSSRSNFDTFEGTNEFTWLIENAYRYGFILRYPKEKEYITGYHYESWHYRYVGKEMAEKIQKENITYEEYYEYYLNKK